MYEVYVTCDESLAFYSTPLLKTTTDIFSVAEREATELCRKGQCAFIRRTDDGAVCGVGPYGGVNTPWLDKDGKEVK